MGCYSPRTNFAPGSNNASLDEGASTQPRVFNSARLPRVCWGVFQPDCVLYASLACVSVPIDIPSSESNCLQTAGLDLNQDQKAQALDGLNTVRRQ